MRTSIITLLGICLSLSAASGNWPMFGGPNRDFTIGEVGLAESWPADGPEVLWQGEVGDGFGGPAIYDGKVYLLDRDGQTGDVLRCFDLQSGRQLYQTAYDAPGKISYHGSRSTPAVTGKFVLTVGPFGDFKCFNRADGKLVWSKHLLKDFGGSLPRWAVAQSPIVDGDVVYVAPQSGRVGLAAFDISTGRELWTSPPVGKMQYVTPLLTTLAGQKQLVMLAGDGASGIDPQTGKMLWKYGNWGCSNAIPQPRVIDGNKLFMTGGYGAGCAMIQVDRNEAGFTVRQLYKNDELNAQITAPLLHEGYLYLVANGNRYKDGLMCADPSDGSVVWKTGDRQFDRGQAVLVGDLMLIIHGQKGTLHLIRPSKEGLKQLAEAELLGGKKIWAPMALSDGLLVIRDQSQIKCVRVGKAD